MFNSPIFLIYFNPSRKLFINLDTSRKWDLKIIIYYIKGPLDTITNCANV